MLSWLVAVDSVCPPAVVFEGWHVGEVKGNPLPWEISSGGICARAIGGLDSSPPLELT